MDWDAAWTDAVLATVALVGAARLRRSPLGRAAGFGLLLVGAAAALGAARYTVLPELQGAHQLATRVASAAGIPLLGAGAALAAVGRAPARAASLAAAFGLATATVALGHLEAYRIVVGGIAMGVGVLAGVALARRRRRAGASVAAGCVAVMLAGLAVAGPGAVAGLSRVGWFHLVLAGAMALIAAGLSDAETAG